MIKEAKSLLDKANQASKVMLNLSEEANVQPRTSLPLLQELKDHGLENVSQDVRTFKKKKDSL